MPVVSLERHVLDARSKTLALLFSNLALGGSVGRGNESLLFQSSLHLDGHGYRTFDGEHGGLPLRALPTHGCTRTKATASHAHFDLCLQSPGWMNQWGSLLWFLSWFGGMRALVGFFRLSMMVSQLCRHVREDVND